MVQAVVVVVGGGAVVVGGGAGGGGAVVVGGGAGGVVGDGLVVVGAGGLVVVVPPLLLVTPPLVDPPEPDELPEPELALLDVDPLLAPDPVLRCGLVPFVVLFVGLVVSLAPDVLVVPLPDVVAPPLA
jgi:hypothetical protein